MIAPKRRVETDEEPKGFSRPQKRCHADSWQQPEHVYFAVPDLEAAFRRAEICRGLSTATGDGDLPMGRIARRPWGELSFYLHDPSGNRLCFVDAQWRLSTRKPSARAFASPTRAAFDRGSPIFPI